jgi:hypothetical protein
VAVRRRGNILRELRGHRRCRTASKNKKNSFHPSKKTSQADLYLTYLNDGVFRSNRRYDSEAQGRHVSIDKNKELTGGET